MSSLISPKALSQQLHDPNLMILDASMPPVGNMQKPTSMWPEVIIPNARRFDIGKHFSDLSSSLPHTLPNTQDFEQACQHLGINRDSRIVVYDNLGMFSSARAWYMLTAMGHDNVQVLNGGLPAWQENSLPTEAAKRNACWPKGNFIAALDNSAFVDADSVEAAIENNQIKILDARARARFTGEVPEPRVGMRSGHIPRSISFPYTELLANGEMKPEGELQQIFEQQHIGDDSSLIMSCGSGITACILALAAYEAGLNNVSVYDGSWSEWGADLIRPIATGT